MKILVSQHPHYNYLDSTILSGLQALGHDVRSIHPHQTNYVSRHADPDFVVSADLYIEFVNRDTPAPRHCKTVLCWGEDSHAGLDKAFSRGFDYVFVRDHLPNEPGIPISFAIEERYIDVTKERLAPLNEREVDICFLGQLGYGNRKEYVDRLKKDFKGCNFVLGPRQFSEPDDKWSKWTLPWAAHDVRYFKMLANSKICLAFRGMGPDTGRLWECLASGAMVVAESWGQAEIVKPSPAGVSWFLGYDDLCDEVEFAFTRIASKQFLMLALQQDNLLFNQKFHSTAARARYLLQHIGMA